MTARDLVPFSRDPEHQRLWLAAMLEGVRRSPKCEMIRRNGEPCRMHALPHTTPRRCLHHLRGAARDAYDLARIPKLLRQRVSGNAINRTKARRALAAIERRQMHRLWKQSPDMPGTTLILSDTDEARVRDWLRAAHGIDLDRDDDGLTYRAVDRVRWAAALALTGRIDEAGAANRIRLARRDDERWRAKDTSR